jgi:hypothetical protein
MDDDAYYWQILSRATDWPYPDGVSDLQDQD